MGDNVIVATSDQVASQFRTEIERFRYLQTNERVVNNKVIFKCCFTGLEYKIDIDKSHELKKLYSELNKLSNDNKKQSDNYIKFKNKNIKYETIDLSKLTIYEEQLKEILENLEDIEICFNDIIDTAPRVMNDIKLNLQYLRDKELQYLISNTKQRLDHLKKAKQKIKNSIFDYKLYNRKYGFIDGKINIDKLRTKVEK